MCFPSIVLRTTKDNSARHANDNNTTQSTFVLHTSARFTCNGLPYRLSSLSEAAVTATPCHDREAAAFGCRAPAGGRVSTVICLAADEAIPIIDAATSAVEGARFAAAAKRRRCFSSPTFLTAPFLHNSSLFARIAPSLTQI